jgi:CelD/BcsL family acetyltransferase involved in cellulose biosynthesis
MSKIELLDPTRDERWDDFVVSHPFGWLCHLSGWKRVLEDSFRHMKGHYFAILDDSGESIQAALPVYQVNSWLTGRRLVSVPFATLSDPLVRDSEELETLLSAAVRLYESSNSSYIEIRALNATQLLANKETKLGCVSRFKHHYLPLKSDPEAVKKVFHAKSVRSAISKSEKSGLDLAEAKSDSDLQTFYNLYFITRKRLGLPPQPFAFFKNIWNLFHSNDQFQILLAFSGRSAVGGLAFFKFKKRLSTEFAGWDVASTEAKPNHFLYWEGIKLACREGYEIFDFGRTETENTGLLAFKRHWGTVEVDLPQFYYPEAKASEIDRGIRQKGRGLVKSVLSRDVPDFIVQRIGKLCYRHLG